MDEAAQRRRRTSSACSTRVEECWRTASTTAVAAALRMTEEEDTATSRGYMRAWGWWRPTRTSSALMSRRTRGWLVWMRAMIWTAKCMLLWVLYLDGHGLPAQRGRKE